MLWIALVLVVLLLGVFIFVQVTWDKIYEAPYPEITISTDSAVLARGRYLVYGPSHCATCHVPMDRLEEVDKGEDVPLIGGWEISFPLGTYRGPNITADKETGIGNLTDAELARSIRHMVSADGSMVFPFMAYQHMSDEDLGAIISYLRSTAPVHNEVPASEMKFMGKALSAFGMLKPEGPKRTPPVSVPREVTVAYGTYIANDVALCKGCHTPRDMMTGAYTGIDFEGGVPFAPEETEMFNGYGFISPNLTKDPETGLLANWTEEAFVARFRAGRVHQYSPMAWGAYSRMDEVELKAIYKYLQSLDPVNNKIEKTVYTPTEEFPE